MGNEDLQRRLAAIVSADVVGYSRLISSDELDTIRTLNACRQRMSALVEARGGKVVDFVGDNMLAEFKSGLAAVETALAMQRGIAELTAGQPEERRMRFRIGIHLGDVTTDGERLYGDGVNIAARLQALAEPGGICISETVHAQIRARVDVSCRDLGEQRLKNIGEAVRACLIPPQGGGREAAGPAPTPSPRSPGPALAVLPFVNLSRDPEQEYMSEGLTLSIVAALVKIPGLLLISDTATIPFKDRSVPVQRLGKELGVTHILDGGIQRSGRRVRVTVRLTDAQGGRQLWAEQFNKDLGDIFALQDEITAEVVEAMDVKLISGETARIVRHALKTPAAIEAYYRGWSALFRSGPGQALEAEVWFDEIVVAEPSSPLGYALSAWTSCLIAGNSTGGSREAALDKASGLARKALELGDITGLPHLTLAYVHLLRHDPDEALRSVEMALLERPSCDASYVVKASVLNFLGRFEEAMPLARKAMRISPVHPSFYPAVLAASAYFSGQYTESLEAADRALDIDQEDVDALVFRTAALERLGRPDQAIAGAKAILQARPGFSLKAYASLQPYRDAAALSHLVGDLEKAGLG
jgi:adenylate cyclase